jgi:hypothetical protein
MTLRKELTELILQMRGVTEKKSRWSDNLAFYIGSKEFAHFHSSNVIDIRLTKRVIRELDLKNQTDRRVQLRSSSDWIEFSFRRSTDIARALELLHAACDSNR